MNRLSGLTRRWLIHLFLALGAASAVTCAHAIAPQLNEADRAWLDAHPVIRYSASPGASPISFVAQGQHAGLAADYLRLLEPQLGVRFQFEAHPSLESALKAARERRVDLLAPMASLPVPDGALVFTGALLKPDAEGADRPLAIAVRGDWSRLAGIIDRAHAAIPTAELDAIRARWREIPDRGYSSQQVTLVVLTLVVASLTITLLVVLWSAFKRRGLARDMERSEALFNAFFNASPAGMAILDRDLRFVRINETQVAMYGRDAGAEPGRSLEDMAPELATVVAPLMREVLLTGRSIHNVEVTGHQDGERHWLASFFPVHSRPGRIPQGVGQVMLDIGDRKRVELALRESENRLRNVSNHLPVALFQYRLSVGGQPGFTYVSEGVGRLLKCPAEAIIARPAAFMDAIHPDDRGGLFTLMTDVVRRRHPGPEVEWTGRRHPDLGPDCWLQIRATVDEGHDGRLSLSGVILDITQLKGVQQALERSRGELRRLSAHREGLVEREHQRLAREFHDELGQVLTTARMHLQMLERNLAAGATIGTRDTVKEIDGMIVEAYRSVKTIASDLRPAALNLGLSAAVEWLASRVLGPAGIRYVIAFDRTADTLDGDYSIALFRIVQESLTNVVRHAQAGHVRISLEQEDGEVRLDIADDGRGFDPSRVDRSARFGLLGVSERVAALGGVLYIDSTPGNGTRLSIVLPYTPLPTETNDRSNSPS